MGLEPAKTGFGASLAVAVVPPKKVFYVENWAQHMKNSVENQKKALRTEIRKFKDLFKEIAQSRGIIVAELLKDHYFALWYERELKKWRKVRQALKQDPDGSTKFGRGLDDGKMKYAKYKRECYYPLFGSEKDGVKGLIPLARMALTGERRLKKHLKPGLDKIVQGDPICICPPEKLKEFRKELNHGISESGTIIIKGGLTEYDIYAQTVQLNRLINFFCSDEIEPFSPGGTSHVDFITIEIPDTDSVAVPLQRDTANYTQQYSAKAELLEYNPGVTQKRLGLDIKVGRKNLP